MRYLSIADAATRLGIDPSRVRVLCRSGRIKAQRPGRDWLIPEGAIVAYEGQRRGPGRPRRAS